MGELEQLATVDLSQEKTDVPQLSKEHSSDFAHTADGELPSEEELHHLRRVSGQVPWSAFTIAFVELCERFSYYGTTAVCMDARLDRTRAF